MSTLHELKDEILKGRGFKRAKWNDYIIFGYNCEIIPCDAIENDWELRPQPKEKKKIKLYAHLYSEQPTHNKLRGVENGMFFSTCPFANYIRLPNLDQEIEVDE